MPAPAPTAKPAEIVKKVRKPRAKAPENETKADRFKRLANHRMPRLLKLLAAVGNLGNAAQYESDSAQRALIVDTLEHAVKKCTDRINGASLVDVPFKL